MATMNLLKSDYEGKLGETTGVRIKGQSVVKSKIYSKRPPNDAQRGAVRSFEAVNRLAGAIARTAFSYTGLSSRDILPHNAVARFLSPMLVNKVFEPENIADILPLSERLTIYDNNNMPENEAFQYIFEVSPNIVISPDEKIIFIIFADTGHVHNCSILDFTNQSLTVSLSGVDRTNIKTLALISTLSSGKRYFSEYANAKELAMKVIDLPVSLWRSVTQTQKVAHFTITQEAIDLGISLTNNILYFSKKGMYFIYFYSNDFDFNVSGNFYLNLSLNEISMPISGFNQQWVNNAAGDSMCFFIKGLSFPVVNTPVSLYLYLSTPNISTVQDNLQDYPFRIVYIPSA